MKTHYFIVSASESVSNPKRTRHHDRFLTPKPTLPFMYTKYMLYFLICATYYTVHTYKNPKE